MLNLEIFLITYNRDSYLESTLNQILNSPVKDCKITIIDNASTDKTPGICSYFTTKYENVYRIRHKRNIGGNANIVRAMEHTGAREYSWVICDDDVFDFTQWDKVIEAMEKDVSLINVSSFNEQGIDDRVKLLRRSCFLPSVIYRSDLIDSNLLQQAYDTGISTILPHLVIPIKVLNENLSFELLPNIVNTGNREDHDTSYNRGCDDLHPFRRTLFWHIGYTVMTQFIKDEQLRELAINQADTKLEYFFNDIIKYNKLFGNQLHNLTDVFCCLNEAQKTVFKSIIGDLFEKQA